jgi:hypothetical protein
MPVTHTSGPDAAEVHAAFLKDIRAALEPRARAELQERRPAVAATAERARECADDAAARCAPLQFDLDRLIGRRRQAETPVPVPDIALVDDDFYDYATLTEQLRGARLAALSARIAVINDELSPLIRDQRVTDLAALVAERELAALDEAIADPFGCAAGYSTSAGQRYVGYLGGGPADMPGGNVGGTHVSPAGDPRVRTRRDGRKVALLVPGEVDPASALLMPPGTPQWDTTAAPAGPPDADPDRTAGFTVGPGIPPGTGGGAPP